MRGVKTVKTVGGAFGWAVTGLKPGVNESGAGRALGSDLR